MIAHPYLSRNRLICLPQAAAKAGGVTLKNTEISGCHHELY
jgi:hypothetical protein